MNINYVFWIYLEQGIKTGKAGTRKMKKSKEAELVKQELEKASARLEAARDNLNYAVENAMIDYYTYLIKANETLYDYLKERYKEMCRSERVVLDGVS